MKNGFTMMAAAAVLAGAMVVGCDSKSDADKAAQSTRDATPGMSGTTPATADKNADTAMKNAGDKMKDMGQQAKDAAKSAGDMMTAEKDKLKDKMGTGAATQPAMPSMPTMK